MPQVWPYYLDTGTAGSTNIWYQWNQTFAEATTMPSTAFFDQGQTGASTYWQPQVWLSWQGFAQPVYTPLNTPSIPSRPLPPASPEAQAQAKRNAFIRNTRNHAFAVRRRLAERRAERLLLEHLSVAQRAEWIEHRAFTVHTADGKRAYRIAYGLAGNIRLVEAKEAPVSKNGYPLAVGTRLCMHVYHPDGHIPNEDNVLAQKLLIESNERAFLDLANALMT